MNKYLYFLIALALLSACKQQQEIPVSNPAPSAPITQIDISLHNGQPSAEARNPNPLTTQLLQDAGRGIEVATDAIAVTNVIFQGKRYISATFEVRNNTNNDLDNLYFIAQDPQNRSEGNPFGNASNFANQPIAIPSSMKLAHARVYSDATQGMIAFNSDYVDNLDIANAKLGSTAGLFPYGFLVKDATRSGRTSISKNGKGRVTFSVELQDLKGAQNDPFKFSIYFYSASIPKQCIGDFIIDDVDTAGDIARVENCVVIEGNLLIYNTDVVNLAFLNKLEKVTGTLSIGKFEGMVGNAKLNQLEGLNNLRHVGGLALYNNDALTSLEGLEQLTMIGEKVDSILASNSLRALSIFAATQSLHIHGNDALTNLRGLDNLGSIHLDLFIKNNARLQNFEGLGNLQAIGAFFHVYDNPALTNFRGLEQLSLIGGKTYYAPLSSSVDDIHTLSALVGGLHIHNNDALLNLAGLEPLSKLGMELSIKENDVLNNIDGLNNIRAELTDGSTISNNPKFDCTLYNQRFQNQSNPTYLYFPLGRSTGNLVNCFTSKTP